ncbi:uncharacterized protein K02A2.6-like [Prunus persica]|uniref:uncharacterized protein K02A2.6-like n=1 Tax=Prunus persica TaxID=3760 RepID=UPI0009AB9644|nr:uncharacterized protein K02A2.6-like [Prunus persica]
MPLGSLHTTLPDSRSQVDLNSHVDQLTQRVDDQNNLISMLLKQINLNQGPNLGPCDEEKRMHKHVNEQFERSQNKGLIGLDLPHNNALVICIQIEQAVIERVHVNESSAANILQLSVIQHMGLEPKISKLARSLTDFNGAMSITVGTIDLDIYLPVVVCLQTFMVIDKVSPYNGILGQPWINKIEAITSALHQKIRYPIPGGGIGHINSDQAKAMRCTAQGLKKSKHLQFTPVMQAANELHVDPTNKPMVQKRRNFAPERVAIIEAEIDKLLAVGFIEEVSHSEWLANVVLVTKQEMGKWKVCINYTDLNKACPKDNFPLPRIDQLVDSTSCNQLLSFMDAYSGYNQILMHDDNKAKTSFIIERGT